MADVSLDELIKRKRVVSGSGIKGRLTVGTSTATTPIDNRFLDNQFLGQPYLSSSHRASNRVTVGSKLQPTVSGRYLATSFQKTFDARQKIGVMDARLKLGIKDAREKLIAKDARFRIKGKLQDARQMLNSRKQQVVLDGKPAKMMDAREKIRLKRSAPATSVKPITFSSSSVVNLTKTIQIPQQKSSHSLLTRPIKEMRINVVNHHHAKQISSTQEVNEEDMEMGHMPTKKIKITATNLQKKQTAMSLPLTKVVQNDTYTAPVFTHPVTTVPSQHSKTLTGVSRTLIAKATSAVLPASNEPAFSPLEGTKMTVNNLHPRVTEEDIVELFCVCGALKRARLLSPGVAEVVFVRKEDAVGAYKKYNNRYLDGQPMKCNLHLNGTVITSDQPILLRLSDTPAKKDLEIRRNSSSSSTSNPVAEVDPETILKALFKSSGSSAMVHPTAFKIKL